MRHILLVLGLASFLTGCGYKELPKMRTEAEAGLKSVMMEYRLRADIVPHLVQLVEGRKDGAWPQQIAELQKARAYAVGMDLPPSQLDEKQINRMASFQYALSSTLVQFINALDQDPKLQKKSELLSIKEQLGRAETRIAEARQKYMSTAPEFNERLKKVPERWFNAWLYKFEPLLILQ